MTHGNIGEGFILVQTPQIPGVPLSFEVLNEVKKRCYLLRLLFITILRFCLFVES